MCLTNIASDKLLHCLCGALIAMLWAEFFPSLSLWAVCFSVLAGLLKELWDLIRKDGTGFELLDLLSTLIGGVLVELIVLIGKLIN